MGEQKPTRAEVERRIELLNSYDHKTVTGFACRMAADMLTALLERAEAAERELAMSRPLYSRRMLEARLVKLNAALVASREAEASAWEAGRDVAAQLAAAQNPWSHLAENIRELRRAAD